MTFGNAAAVPQAKIKETQYDKQKAQFKNCYEFDIYFTIDKDLDDEQQEIKVQNLS